MIVALGGDGFVLQTLRRFIDRKVSVFGMNRGSVGFLMNDYNATDLAERLARAEPVTLHPLVMDAVTVHGESRQSFAFNEVSLLRQTYQAAKLEITVDGIVRLPELICDGALVSTTARSEEHT